MRRLANEGARPYYQNHYQGSGLLPRGLLLVDGELYDGRNSYHGAFATYGSGPRSEQSNKPQRDQRLRESEERQAHVRGYGRGCSPAYESC